MFNEKYPACQESKITGFPHPRFARHSPRRLTVPGTVRSSGLRALRFGYRRLTVNLNNPQVYIENPHISPQIS